MQKFDATFNGTGAALFLDVGFIPDEVIIRSLEAANSPSVTWKRSFRAADIINGFLDTDGATGLTLYTAGQGVEIYRGGDVMDASNQTSVAYGEGVYLSLNSRPNINLARQKSNLVSPAGDGEGADINKWVLDTAGNRTGHFNVNVQAGTPWIGEGSEIVIEGKQAIIEAVAAGAGSADDSVTLSEPMASGNIDKIGPTYDMIPTPLGSTTGQGVKLNVVTPININDETQLITVVKYSM